MPARPFLSGFAKLDPKKARVSLLSDVARSAGWESLVDGEVLVAEFIDEGHYRLFRKTVIQPRIVAAEKATNYGASAEQDIELQILSDLYREVVFHKSDNSRVALKIDIVYGLLGDPPHPAQPRLYQQAGPDWVDLMTNKYRLQRMKSMRARELD
jgi:hypothetical protein